MNRIARHLAALDDRPRPACALVDLVERHAGDGALPADVVLVLRLLAEMVRQLERAGVRITVSGLPQIDAALGRLAVAHADLTRLVADLNRLATEGES